MDGVTRPTPFYFTMTDVNKASTAFTVDSYVDADPWQRFVRQRCYDVKKKKD